MEIKIDRDALLKGVSRAQGILEKRSYMPILSTILLTTKENEVEISATDLEIGFQSRYPAEILQSGSVTISGKSLLDITRETNSRYIYILEKENNWIYISDNNAHYNLSCLPSDEFPILTEPEGIIMIEINNNVLSEMINKTIYSITTEDTGFNLSGVFMEAVIKGSEHFLRMVATDGHRLSLIDKQIPDLPKIDMKQGVMIPKKGLIELNKLALENGNIFFGLNQNNFIGKKDHTLIVVRLLNTKFPNYKDVILPKKEEKTNLITINRNLFLESMRRMMIVGGGQYQGVKLTIGIDYLEMVSVNPDLGDVEEKIEVKYNGEPIEIGFNPKYFIDVLQTMESDMLFLNIKDQMSPCLITGEQDEGFLGLIMPMRV
jgi:DNA polymerase III subunit beta